MEPPRRAPARTLNIEPIGFVRSPLKARKNAPRRSSEGPPAVLEIDERFAPALVGLEPGSEIIVVTWLHESVRDVLQVHPGRGESRPLTGVFAGRSPDRPNPIGLHHTVVTDIVAPAEVNVAAIEAIDGTPILDLKLAVGTGESR
jgi:tRNA-Thr(GGU) m(6)t(6)A37 methyltransferase TsaA